MNAEPTSSAAVTLVRESIANALVERGLRPKKGRILVALSGGPDSRVLLDALVALAPAHKLVLSVCIVDHGLRRGSAKEARAALEVARRLGVTGTVERVVIEDKTARGAREARYAALGRAAVGCKAEAIALGHTASDQAETLIGHLLRGAGSRGLGAMEPKRPLHVPGLEHVQLIRPLLECSRAQIEAYVEAEGLAVVRDPTNLDLRFRRSRIRARVMPLLREERPDLDLALVRLCERLRQDAELLDELGDAARRQLTSPTDYVDLDGLAALHPALQARVLRAMAVQAGVEGDRIPLDALLRLGRGRHGTSRIDLPGGVVAERRYGGLRIHSDEEPEAASIEEGTVVPRAGRYPVAGLVLHVPKDFAALGPTVLRRPRPGDRVGSRKLSDILIDQKVARPERKRLWALADAANEGSVRWVVLPATPGTGSWEWPCSGIRPRVEAVATQRPSKRSSGHPSEVSKSRSRR